MQSLTGLCLFFALAWLASTDRSAFNIRIPLIAIAVQLALAGVLLKFDYLSNAFALINSAVLGLQDATRVGSQFVFGYLADAIPPFTISDGHSSFILAFQALPLIIVLSAITALLTHWRILPMIVSAIAKGLQNTFNISGAVGLGSAANIFVGMVEAPLFVRPYLARMTQSELFILMTTGLATIAGTVLILYVTFLQGVVENPTQHLLIASLISVPASIAIALVMVPPNSPATSTAPNVPLSPFTTPSPHASAMDAIVEGTENGLKLCLQIVALLIVLVALVHLCNAILGWVFPSIDGAPITLQRILGVVCAPLAWAMGVAWSECLIAGQLIGLKTVLNELIAYRQLAELPAESLSEHSRLILIYALSGFANIGSLGILIAGFSVMAPERRIEIIALGPRAVLGGTLATLLTGSIIGLIA